MWVVATILPLCEPSCRFTSASGVSASSTTPAGEARPRGRADARQSGECSAPGRQHGTEMSRQLKAYCRYGDAQPVPLSTHRAGVRPDPRAVVPPAPAERAVYLPSASSLGLPLGASTPAWQTGASGVEPHTSIRGTRSATCQRDGREASARGPIGWCHRGCAQRGGGPASRSRQPDRQRCVT